MTNVLHLGASIQCIPVIHIVKDQNKAKCSLAILVFLIICAAYTWFVWKMASKQSCAPPQLKHIYTMSFHTAGLKISF